MRVLQRSLLALFSVFAVVFLATCGGGGGGGAPVTTPNTVTFTATLTLEQEVPTPATPAVRPNGSGTLTLDLTAKTLTGSFTTANVVSPTAAHIHDGEIGVAGAVVVPLTETPTGSGIWVVPAGAALTDAQIARLRGGNYYVNVHTTLNTSGEIRGQLIPPGSTATAFSATLTLEQERPTAATPAVRPSGSGTVTLDPVTKTLTGSFTTTNVVSATAAHIHDGDIGVAGAVVVPLTQTAAGSGIWTVPAGATLTDAQIARLRGGNYYVNVHTTLNTSGEIRGQLLPPG